MSEAISLNRFGKPLSMTPEAIRKRDYRDRKAKSSRMSEHANLSQAGPSHAMRDRINNGHARVVQFNGRTTGHAETIKQGQRLNGQDTSQATTQILSHAAPSLAPDEVRSRALPPNVGESPVPRPNNWRWLIVTLRVVGILGVLSGLGSNGSFLMEQAQGLRQMIIMFGVSLFYDLLVITLPSVGLLFWRERVRLDSLVCMGTYSLCIVFAGLAAVGFAYQNIGDTAAGRETAVNARHSLDRELTIARNELGTLKVVPVSPEQIAAASEARDGVCDPEIRRAYDAKKCQANREVLGRLTGQAAINTRAKSVEDKIADLSKRLGEAPKAASVNPQAEGVAAIFAAVLAIGGWNLNIDPRGWLALNYFQFMFIPVVAGFCFGWALLIEMLKARRLSERRKA